ncbi:hypothetical protein TCT1_31490 [Xenorhabdus sp. TCT-1]|uniref:Secreted protein n=1 Tax=Xenorhabdus taiwanensis TaxID=3085177 RepID=A0ABN7C771_9GAMM|nr:hypothetical protein TCT1_31490 [Xenorhabdus sp. TCT-1]
MIQSFIVKYAALLAAIILSIFLLSSLSVVIPLDSTISVTLIPNTQCEIQKCGINFKLDEKQPNFKEVGKKTAKEIILS